MDSELISLLQRNGIPSDAQATILRNLLYSGEAEISDMENTVTALLLRVSELRAQSARKQEALAPLRGALSTLRQMPIEIMGHIFSCCVENSRRRVRVPIMDAREAPLLLGHVCAHWRVVSFSLPQLWNTVEFSNTTVLIPDVAATIRTLLARTGALPLHLLVRRPHWPKSVVNLFPADADANVAFLELVFDLHHRMKTMALDLTSNQVLKLMRPIFTAARSYPVLSSFSLDIDEPWLSGLDTPIDVMGILDSFQRSPLLQDLELSWSHTLTRSIALSTLPWSGLRNLRLQFNIQLEEARDILMQCRTLESARFSLPYNQPLPNVSAPRSCILPNLLELYLSVPDHDIPSAPFFDVFTCPKLHTISLDVGYISVDSFQRFATRSEFKLGHLSLERVSDITADDLSIYLRNQPMLRTLSIINCGCCGDPALFELFLHDPDVPGGCVLLPELTRLVLGQYYGYRMTGNCVADMAEALCRYRGPGSPFPVLEHVALMTHSADEGSRFSDEAEDRLAAVVGTGLIIREVSPDPFDITAYTEGDPRHR